MLNMTSISQTLNNINDYNNSKIIKWTFNRVKLNNGKHESAVTVITNIAISFNLITITISIVIVIVIAIIVIMFIIVLKVWWRFSCRHRKPASKQIFCLTWRWCTVNVKCMRHLPPAIACYMQLCLHCQKTSNRAFIITLRQMLNYSYEYISLVHRHEHHCLNERLINFFVFFFFFLPIWAG